MSTITREKYIRLCAQKVDPIVTYNWYYYAIAIPDLVDTKEDEIENLMPFTKADGMYTRIDGVDYKFSDYKAGKPLFSIEDPIHLEKGFLPNITKDIDTTVGRLILNTIIYEGIYDDTEFLNESLMDTKTFENSLAKRTIDADVPREKGNISVDEFREGQTRLSFLEGLGDLVVTSSSPRSITKAPGMTEFRNRKIKEYGDRLNTPIGLVEFEEEMAAYDREYLKGDIVYDTVFARKTKTARGKMYAVIGDTTAFIDDPNESNNLLVSIEDGMSLKPSDLVKYFNDSRAGSFYRGDRTALGGYTYELLQKSLGSMRISETPCNTTKGLKKYMNDNEVNYSIGRYYKTNNTWKLIRSTKEAEALKGKIIEMRSPMTCKAKGNHYCYACISVAYKNNPSGISNIVALISSVILGMFMAFMHSVKSDAAIMRKEDIVN